jgi:hypothetical protein
MVLQAHSNTPVEYSKSKTNCSDGHHLTATLREGENHFQTYFVGYIIDKETTGTAPCKLTFVESKNKISFIFYIGSVEEQGHIGRLFLKFISIHATSVTGSDDKNDTLRRCTSICTFCVGLNIQIFDRV